MTSERLIDCIITFFITFIVFCLFYSFEVCALNTCFNLLQLAATLFIGLFIVKYINERTNDITHKKGILNKLLDSYTYIIDEHNCQLVKFLLKPTKTNKKDIGLFFTKINNNQSMLETIIKPCEFLSKKSVIKGKLEFIKSQIEILQIIIMCENWSDPKLKYTGEQQFKVTKTLNVINQKTLEIKIDIYS